MNRPITVRLWEVVAAIALLLVLAVVAFVPALPVQSQIQTDTWQFTANRQVRITTERQIEGALVRWMQPGETINVQGSYVQADDLIWIQVAGVQQYAAVARYGQCEIRSFGTYEPPQLAPVSVGE